jgi:phage tail sheath protein FI
MLNCIRFFSGSGIVVWGTRTLKNSDYKYIPNRRTILYIEDSLTNSLRWGAFRPNTAEGLWNALKQSAEGFLRVMHSQGAFKGKDEKEAFFVKCDADINTADVIDAGITYVDLGVALSKPSEFIVFRIAVMR